MRTSDPSARVLVVEENLTARDALCELLTQEGYRVEAVTTPEAALTKAAEFEPDVVVADLPRQWHTDTTLVDRLRDVPRPPAVVVVTASVVCSYLLLEAGATAILSKPIDLDCLLHTLQRMVA